MIKVTDKKDLIKKDKMNKTKRKFRIFLIIVFLIYVFSTCIKWASTIKYDGAPDEKMKYDVCKYMFMYSKIPHGGDESIRDARYGFSYAFSPVLSYMVSAVFMKIIAKFTLNPEALLLSARFVSVLCITGFAAMCIKISKKLFKGIYKYLFVVFAVLIPQVIFLGSYIDNDSIALLSISIIVYSWILGLETNWNWQSCIIMAIGLGICSLSYYNAYGYILSSIIIYCVSCIIKKLKFKEFFKKGIVIALIAFAIGGWWFIRSYIIYDGDFLGLKTSVEYKKMYGAEGFKNKWTPYTIGYTLPMMFINLHWIEKTAKSFVGVFGYMKVFMDENIYRAYGIVFLIGVIGLFLGIIYKVIKCIVYKIIKKKIVYDDITKKKNKEKILFNIMMIINIIIPIVLSIYYSYYNDFQPQGRYIMPALIPFIYFVVKGYQNIFDTLIRNKTIKNILLSALILIWSIAPIFVYFWYIK